MQQLLLLTMMIIQLLLLLLLLLLQLLLLLGTPAREGFPLTMSGGYTSIPGACHTIQAALAAICSRSTFSSC